MALVVPLICPREAPCSLANFSSVTLFEALFDCFGGAFGVDCVFKEAPFRLGSGGSCRVLLAARWLPPLARASLRGRPLTPESSTNSLSLDY